MPRRTRCWTEQRKTRAYGLVQTYLQVLLETQWRLADSATADIALDRALCCSLAGVGVVDVVEHVVVSNKFHASKMAGSRKTRLPPDAQRDFSTLAIPRDAACDHHPGIGRIDDGERGDAGLLVCLPDPDEVRVLFVLFSALWRSVVAVTGRRCAVRGTRWKTSHGRSSSKNKCFACGRGGLVLGDAVESWTGCLRCRDMGDGMS